MKIIELLSGINIPLNNEEAELLEQFDINTKILKQKLTPREQAIANQLVEKSILLRLNENGKIIFKRKIRY